MRYNYPISSQELLDNVDQIYEMQLYVLGTSGVSNIYSGVYNIIEGSGINTFSSGYIEFESLSPYIGKANYINKNIIK